MIRQELKEYRQLIDTEIECDICHVKYPIGFVENESTIDFNTRTGEIDEFVKIYTLCGYSSIIQDGLELSIDICQHCFYKMFKDIIDKQKG